MARSEFGLPPDPQGSAGRLERRLRTTFPPSILILQYVLYHVTSLHSHI